MKSPEFIAELSANHQGSIEIAEATIQAAKFAGADAVKLQTFIPDQMVGPKDFVIRDGKWKGKNLLELYQKTHTPREWHERLFDKIHEYGMKALSTPFHPDDVEFLESIGCARYKIASFEINYHDLLVSIALTGKPIILSTGMASLHEISQAFHVITAVNPECDLTILKCTSAYPSLPSDANLAAMKHIHAVLNCKVGVSDHTITDDVAIAATMLGASIIEKHFTLSRKNGGEDADFSVHPEEFMNMVLKCESVASTFGDVVYGETLTQSSSMKLRRSLWLAKDVKKGEQITHEHIKVARPFYEIDAAYEHGVIGQIAEFDAKAGDPITFRLVNL